MFGHFTELVANASGWAYAIVIALAFLDAIVPVVPSETAVITAGVVASAGDLSLALIILAAAAGAMLGDNAAYLIGLRFGGPFANRFLKGEEARARLDWARGQLRERGGELIVTGRFIPGGRTAVTLSAGILRFSWKRFIAFDVLAATLWACYCGLLGYFGGRTFEGAAWKGLLLALGLALAIGGLIEVVRRWLRGRSREPA